MEQRFTGAAEASLISQADVAALGSYGIEARRKRRVTTAWRPVLRSRLTSADYLDRDPVRLEPLLGLGPQPLTT